MIIHTTLCPAFLPARIRYTPSCFKNSPQHFNITSSEKMLIINKTEFYFWWKFTLQAGLLPFHPQHRAYYSNEFWTRRKQPAKFLAEPSFPIYKRTRSHHTCKVQTFSFIEVYSEREIFVLSFRKRCVNKRKSCFFFVHS